ncbi:hypothetical protein Agub_g15016 [Astrephomene gubernaculifera]|uniref:Uncharacterized protein n=1 Tax=Astrephomene gubernaculifera TaxID=47775 RepID=A0AAD3E430_9CHLO|nr:hypothetical protein Agub_g15016 [Astrephomene gubernaculifera]
MSRSSNRGPRADIALLRKLKADPNFSPSSLLNAGPNFLEKANKLKGFVAEQRGKLGASAAKTEWLLAYQQLQNEQDDAERELTTCLQQLAEQPSTELREAAEALSLLHTQSDACRSERAQLRSRVKGLSSVHASFRAYGAPSQFSKEASALKNEMAVLGQELAAALGQLGEEAATLTSELRDAWPSALATPGAGLGALAGGQAEGQVGEGSSGGGGGGGGDLVPLPGPGDSRGEDLEELERMLARYPVASPDIKERIREVLLALQNNYLERLETWRLETERTASNLFASTSASSSAQSPATASTQQPRQLPQQQHQQQRGTAAVAGPARPGGKAGAGTGSCGSGGASTSAGGGGSNDTEWCMTACPEPGSLLGGGSGGGGGNSSSSSSSAAVSWLLSGYGGWSAEEHSAFVRHRDRLLREGGQSGKNLPRDDMLARIGRLLPSRPSLAQLRSHEAWATSSRLAARRRRDLAEGWERERRQFLEDSASFLQESEAAFLAQAEAAADRLVAELVRERARDELEELLAERAREDEVVAAERAARQAAEAEAAAAAESRARQEKALKRDMVAAYRAELERQQAEAAAAAAEEERQAALVAEQQAVYNRERVEVRQAEYLERQEQAKERQEAAAAAAAARAARLARLAALVAPEVAADPARLLAHTAASNAALAAMGERSEGAFHPVNGYTTDQVVRDQRFKIMEALAAVGLHETEYGRRVIAAARPAKPTRPDNFTSEQREAIGGNRR